MSTALATKPKMLAPSVARDKASDKNLILLALVKSGKKLTREKMGNPRISVLIQMEEMELLDGSLRYQGADRQYTLTDEGRKLAILKSSHGYRTSAWHILDKLKGQQYHGLTRSALGGPTLFQLDDMLEDGFITVTQEKRPAVRDKVNVYRLTEYGSYVRKQTNRLKVVETYYYVREGADVSKTERWTPPVDTGQGMPDFTEKVKPPAPISLVKRPDWRDRDVRGFKLHEIGIRTRTAGWANAAELRPHLVADYELSAEDVEDILALEFPLRAFNLADYLLQLPRKRSQWTLQQRYYVLCWEMDTPRMWKLQRIY